MTTSTTPQTFSLESLTSLVDETAIQPWEAIDGDLRDRIARSIAPSVTILGLVSPGTQAELGAVMAAAHRQRCPVLPLGAGSKIDWGGLVGNPGENLLLLSLARINRLIEHAVGDLTVTVEAGINFADLQKTLAAAGQFLAIDPTDPDRATIGGIIATGDTGSLRQRYNSVRDMVLGITFVRADGQVAKAGGRVVKNVAGYDLMKLLTGSYGTLGIVTQVTLRVYPLSEATQTIVLTGEAAALSSAAQTLRSSALTPTQADLLSASLVNRLFNRTGMGLVVRFQGMRSGVEQQTQRLVEVGQAIGLTHTTWSGDDELALWQRLSAQMLPDTPSAQIACKIGIGPTHGVALCQQLESMSVPSFCQIHNASGVGRLLVLEALPDMSAFNPIRAFCQSHQGYVSILQAPIAVKQTLDVWGYPGNGLNLMRQIKQQFDPDQLLSPHRFIGGI